MVSEPKITNKTFSIYFCFSNFELTKYKYLNQINSSIFRNNWAFIKRTFKDGQNFGQITLSAKIKIAYLCSAHQDLSEYTKILSIFGCQNELIILSQSIFSVFLYSKIALFYFFFTKWK